jgi:hypothetical protein
VVLGNKKQVRVKKVFLNDLGGHNKFTGGGKFSYFDRTQPHLITSVHK